MAKIINIFLSLLLFLSCSHYSQDRCLQNKLTFDIGSGSTKYYYAQVNTCTHTVIKVITHDSFRYPFKQILQKSTDNRFPLKEQHKFVTKLQQIIDKYPAKLKAAVATSAFRTSNNGTQFTRYIEKQTTLPVKIITQKEEAKLGFTAVKNLVSYQHLLYWDVGGGSMQMILSTGGQEYLYQGKIGAASFKQMVLKEVFHNKRKSPNPLGIKNINSVIKIARNFAKKTIPSSFKLLNSTIKVCGIGGVHQYSILKNRSDKKMSYTQQDLLKWLQKKSKLSDKILNSPYSQTDVTNLALILGYMRELNIEKVNVIPNINMAYALLHQW